ncbi:O-Antigen ligase [Mariniflexile rhizosphaerae]|uniref:O-antigen ligase family protein n=1 Tax=unclassified Mariniflexile TaxID=2643887 RepID=UPI000CAA78DC|nr:O-antigen ligase family protein [Mariniflexile sp. TRM1-10]AXP80581.1 O-Antigen ligase [Mariniflexile sp. TRM1-10]PLB20125.1 MAG: O-antigen polymerase [Flavobacteriaceae bacterium FS1-H7996/R]
MDNKRDYILFLILCLNALIILFPSNFKFIPILLLGGFSIKVFFERRKMDYHFFVLSSLPYLILVFGMLYTEDISYGIKRLETGASLIIYPLFFSLLSKEMLKIQLDRYGKNIFTVFVVGTLVFSYSIFIYFAITENRGLTYLIQHYNTLIDQSINSKYQIHSIYLALQVGISIIFSVFILFKYKNKFDLIFAILCVLLSVFLLIVMNKRMAIIAVVFVGIIMLFVNIKKLKNKFLFLFFGGIFLLLISLGVVLFPRYKGYNGFKEFSNIENTINDSTTSIGKRVLIYKKAYNLVIKEPILGFGTGDANGILSKTVINNNENINSHNQFLSYLILTGLLGFQLFLCYMFCLFKETIASRDFLFLGILLFFVLNMLSENILEREAGVICFAFICNLFLRKNFN